MDDVADREYSVRGLAGGSAHAGNRLDHVRHGSIVLLNDVDDAPTAERPGVEGLSP